MHISMWIGCKLKINLSVCYLTTCSSNLKTRFPSIVISRGDLKDSNSRVEKMDAESHFYSRCPNASIVVAKGLITTSKQMNPVLFELFDKFDGRLSQVQEPILFLISASHIIVFVEKTKIV